jgi:hypothetical protein
MLRATRLLCFLLLLAPLSHAAENLLRNGSFEGGLLYWHQIDAKQHTLVRDATAGEFALRIAKGNIMSAPFVAERGKLMTVSFSVKGEKAGKVGVQMPPSAREPGTKAKRLWMREGEQSAEITTEWKRVSFTWPADVPTEGFWPQPHYLVQIGGYDQPILVDGVTVTVGKEATPAYVPRSGIEVVAECANLPGWDGAAGNAFDKGATAQMVAHVSNPTTASRDVIVRWQFVDYEGETQVGPPIDKKITLAAGKTFTATTPMLLNRNGFVFARLSVIDPTGDTVIDKSDFPLTSIPYPKAATKPDFRERFGGSFAGREMMLQKYQRLGFGWTRWFPETKWQFFQPKAGDPFNWHDEDFALAAKYGVSQHVVLYGWPTGLMDKEHSGQPLPLDMKWKADDPRWDDLKLETAWDKFVKAAAVHFKGKSIIFEISNEPEFDKWEKFYPEYAKFTIRTAKLIRATDPAAKIMLNNVYGIPSPVNAAFFKAGGLKYIDVVSWHDYHAGWLTDAQGIKRMRQNMDEAGGKHVEIWFNEGWAYTNTAVDEPIACTHLTAAQSTNAHACSVAEMTIAGQEKTILFHTGYEDHGQSFWDYSGPGTLLWDWYGYPLPLVGMWNVLNHHIGISDEVGFVRPPGANITIFQDLRNGRGVMIAYADRESKADVTVELPDLGAPLLAEDIMGNVAPAAKKLTLPKTGRPVLLYTATKTPGKTFLTKLEPLDRKNASFVSSAPGASPEFKLPAQWDGKEKGSSEGSVAMANGKPIWKLEQLWPADWKQPGNFKPMIWTGTDWNVKEGGFGGQPGATLKDGALGFGTRAPHGPDNDRHLRTAGLTFVAPAAGNYALHGKVTCNMWDSKNETTLFLLRKTTNKVEKVGSLRIAHQGESSLEGQTVELPAGGELTLLPQIDGNFAGGDCKLKEFSISLADGKAAATGAGYRLPAVWEGIKKGSADGNPIAANGQPIWRIDRLYPGDAIMTANYTPMIWEGTRWAAADHTHGGHPSAVIADGKLTFAAMGPWPGDLNFPKIPVLVFIAPKSATYQITGTASSKPWEGGAKTYPLSLRKKDAQRAAEITTLQLPRDGTLVLIKAEIELTEGHELLFVPMTQDLHNNSSNISLEALEIKPAR